MIDAVKEKMVIAAILQGKEAYLTLFAGHPLSPEQKKRRKWNMK